MFQNNNNICFIGSCFKHFQASLPGLDLTTEVQILAANANPASNQLQHLVSERSMKALSTLCLLPLIIVWKLFVILIFKYRSSNKSESGPLVLDQKTKTHRLSALERERAEWNDRNQYDSSSGWIFPPPQ